MKTPIRWKSFGARLIGPGHVATGKPNQDSWSSFHRFWGDGIAASDGVGSKALSGYGSDAACRAVERAARRASQEHARGQRSHLLAYLLDEWLALTAPLDPNDVSATCLYALRLGDGVIRLGMLGDGCVAVMATDGEVATLMDDKTSSFSNLTNALKPSTTTTDWALLEVPEPECEAVVLCTDGVSDDLVDVEGFMTAFVTAHRDLARLAASRRVRELLGDWPCPKHSDDKTIACLLRSVSSDD